MKPWTRYFHLGFVYQTLYLGSDLAAMSLVDTIRPIIEDDFFQAVEFTHIRNSRQKQIVKSLIDQKGKVVVFSGVTPIFRDALNLSDLLEARRKKAVQRLIPLFDEAHEFNAKVFLIASGPDPGYDQRDRAKEQLKHSIIDLWEYGERQNYNRDTMISMEIFDREVEIKFLYGPTAEASQFARSLREDGIQLYLSLDQGHLYLLQESPSHSIHEAKGFSLHFHLGNCIAKDPANPAFGAKHPAFGLPGGEVGYREIAAFMFFLKTNHYFEQLKPILSFEVRPIMGENPAQIIRQSKEEFLKAWDLFQDSM